MHSPIHHHRLALACALLVAAVAPATASAAVHAKLRVEATNGKILAQRTQAISPVKVKTDRGADCFGAGSGGSGKKVKIPNPTALGLLADAISKVPALDPLSITDHFSFGLGLCGIGNQVASGDAFWYLKRNHVGSQVGGDQTKVKDGDQILWYLAPSFPPGDELALNLPKRAKPGDAVTATVTSYTDKGKRKPAKGATVPFADHRTNAKGKTKVVFPSAGHRRVQAKLAGDIPSNAVGVCVKAKPRKCDRG